MLWKNSVSTAFYAVFFDWEPKKATKISLFCHAPSEKPEFLLSAGLLPVDVRSNVEYCSHGRAPTYKLELWL